jgi:hypothetical protein
MDDSTLHKAYRNGWILLLLVAAFVVAFVVFALRENLDHPPVAWDMGGVRFVPASSPYASGYYTGLEQPARDVGVEGRR